MSHGTDKHLEHAEHAQHSAHDPFDRKVAMTMTMMAAILAGVTLVSHRGHTETLRLATVASSKHTEATDQWNLYQAKHIRSNEYQAFLFLEELLNKDGVKQDDESKAMRNYWINQVNKYEGEGYWTKFKESVLAKKDKSKTAAKPEEKPRMIPRPRTMMATTQRRKSPRTRRKKAVGGKTATSTS